MQHLSTAFLIIALVIVVQDGVNAQLSNYDKTDQIAQEAKNRAVTIIDGPKYVPPPQTSPPPTANNTLKPEQRPPSKPPINPTPDKHGKKYVEMPRVYYGQIQNLPPLRSPYSKQLKIQQPNTIYKYHKVIPLPPNRNNYRQKQQQLVFAASSSKPLIISKSPKISLPVETINGIRSDFVRPPHFINTTSSSSTSTTTTATTTRKLLRTKRIWPKRMLEKMHASASNTTVNTSVNKIDNATSRDLQSSPSHHNYVYANSTLTESTSAHPSTTRGYRRVERVPNHKKRSTTPSPANFTRFETNEWVPILPSHFPRNKVRKFKQTPINRRSDVYLYNPDNPDETSAPSKRMLYLQSYGLVPVASSQSPSSVMARKNIIYVGRGNEHLKTHVYSGYRRKPVIHSSHVLEDHQSEASHHPKFITKVKHHHHHHHHKYIKTVEKPVKVEVPKPVPVPVPMPVPVKVERRVPYPVEVKVPHPVPVRVVEKEYVPKPYPVIQHVPIYKEVQVKVPQPVPYPVEKKVPYPVQVPVHVNKPYPVPVEVEKRVPYPVPVKILVPQPYPVETKVPYPVQVKEPVEVIKHVQVRVPYPQPYPVRVPVRIPVPYEKKVPYPVEVEKKVPVPYRVIVPEKVEVEKRVPVYVPKPFPVEKKVPYPVRIPYPVRVPIKVPFGIPILINPEDHDQNIAGQIGEYQDHLVTGQVSVEDYDIGTAPSQNLHYSYGVGNSVTNSPQHTVTVHGNTGVTANILSASTELPQHTVTYHGSTVTNSSPHAETVHGNIGFNGFQSRSDLVEETTTLDAASTSQSTAITSEETVKSVTSLFDEGATVTGNQTPLDNVNPTTLDPR